MIYYIILCYAEVIIISSHKTKIWHDYQNKKHIRIITRYNKKLKRTILKHLNETEYLRSEHIIENGRGSYVADAPIVFSVIKNPSETIYFFNIIISNLKSNNINLRYTFNLSNVAEITTDALMYLLAIVKNFKKEKIKKCEFIVKIPTNQEVMKIIKESGFLNYTYNRTVDIIPMVDKIFIQTGNNTDGILAKKVCDFVQKNLCINMQQTNALYKTLIELMSNTYHHAYNDDSVLNKSWYIFSEFSNNKIIIIFLDVGSGIPTTINKRVYETIDVNNVIIKDSEYILSAFEGKNRTETQFEHRGNGLPEIYSYCKNDDLKNFVVVSGKGICKISKKNIKEDIKNKLLGTVYRWEIDAI